MKNYKEITGQIVGLKRLNNSVNGNPQFLVRIYKIDETIELRTQANAGWVYGITENWLNRWATFKVAGNQRQRLIDIELETPVTFEMAK